MRHFGYFVTESSRHMSEYTPWFRRTEALRERFAPPPPAWMRQTQAAATGQAAGGAAAAAAGAPAAGTAMPGGGLARRVAYYDRMREQLDGTEPLPFERTHEYCSHILHAVETNTPYRFNGNVPNAGLITNLPPGCNVEVPILADNTGLRPCHVGELPAACASINRTNVNVQELAVKAILEQNRELVYQAIALDPLTTTQCSLDDVRRMTDELFEASAAHLRF